MRKENLKKSSLVKNDPYRASEKKRDHNLPEKANTGRTKKFITGVRPQPATGGGGGGGGGGGVGGGGAFESN